MKLFEPKNEIERSRNLPYCYYSYYYYYYYYYYYTTGTAIVCDCEFRIQQKHPCDDV